jgi:hypothetical protein
MGEVGRVAGAEVINTDDLIAFCEEGIAEMRAEKTTSTGDESDLL